MSSLTSLEAYDLLRFSEVLEERLAHAEVAQTSRAGLEREKAWLSEALALLRAERAGVAAILERARDLPELGEVREDYSIEMQGAWVDALEKVHAGITFHAGSRAPVIEALFPHQKFPALRKTSPEGVRAYAAEFDRRSRMGYVKRIFTLPDFAPVVPVVLAVPEALRRWEACFEPSTMSEEQAAPIREELAAFAYRLDRVMRQARLLAEASLLPVDGAFEESGVGARPRRRLGTVPTEAPLSDVGAIVDDGISLAEALGLGLPPEGTDAEQAGAPLDEMPLGEMPLGEMPLDAAQADGVPPDAPPEPSLPEPPAEAAGEAAPPPEGSSPEPEAGAAEAPEPAPVEEAAAEPVAAPPADPKPRRARKKRADRSASDA